MDKLPIQQFAKGRILRMFQIKWNQNSKQQIYILKLKNKKNVSARLYNIENFKTVHDKYCKSRSGSYYELPSLDLCCLQIIHIQFWYFKC